MSVFIPGMEMPKNCAECKFWCVCKPISADFDDWISIDEAVNDGFLVRHELCPLVEVKAPHGRLIDADAFEDAFIRYYLNQERQDHLMFAAVEIKQHLADMIADFPAIIEAEGGGEDG